MAVLCPIYDPFHGWYIIDEGGKKKFFTSILHYYYSLGVNPPVGAKITQDDYDEFQAQLHPDSYNEDADYDVLDYLPVTYPENFMPKLSVLPPSVQVQSMFGFPSLSESVNETPLTTLTVPYAPMTSPNYVVGPSISFSDQQSLTQADHNEIALLNELHNFCLPSMTKITPDEVIDTLDDQDEFEEGSFMSDFSSTKSSSIHWNVL